MPIPITGEQADIMLEPFLARQQDTPQAVFGLPPPVPMTNLFSATRSFGRGYGRTPDMAALWSKANDIRLAQAAEQQALAVTQHLQEVDPTSPNYLSQRTQLLKRYPLAQESPLGQRAIAATDYEFEKTRTESDPNRSFMQQAALAGVTPEEAAAFTDPATGQVDYISLGNLAGERKRQAQMALRRPERDTTLRDKTEEYESLNLMKSANPQMREQIVARQKQIAAEILQLTGGQPPVPGIPATAPAVPAASDFQAVYDALPKGSRYTDPNGVSRIKQ